MKYRIWKFEKGSAYLGEMATSPREMVVVHFWFAYAVLTKCSSLSSRVTKVQTVSHSSFYSLVFSFFKLSLLFLFLP